MEPVGGVLFVIVAMFAGAGCRKAHCDQERIDAGYYTMYLGKKYAHYGNQPMHNTRRRVH